MFVNFVKERVVHNPIIIEAGAHFGGDTIRMSRIWPLATVYAFEPNPKLHQILRNIASSHENIRFFPLALGPKIGEADFFQNIERDVGSDSTLEPLPHMSVDKYIHLKVPMTTLDAWDQEYKIERVDFMRLDMQGAEGEMLQASPNILKKTKFIQVETNEGHIYENTMQFNDLINLLSQNGFRLLYHVKGAQEDIQGDALFEKIENV